MSQAIGVQLQLLKGSAGTYTATFYNDDGVAADPGVTTVAVADEAGTAIVASGAAGGTGTTRTVAYTGTHTANLNRWVVSWTTTAFGVLTTHTEVVGAFLFSVAEARTYRDAALTDTTKYPTALIERARARITDDFEAILGFAPIPRYRLDTLDGSGTTTLFLPTLYASALRTVEERTSGGVTWTAFDAATLADVFGKESGYIYRETLGSWTTGTANYRIGYEAGRWTNVPGQIKEAALMACRFELVDKNVGDRAISLSTEFGTTQYWQPGMGGHVHELPYVNTRLEQFIERRIAVA